MSLRLSKSNYTAASFRAINFDSSAQSFISTAGITSAVQQKAVNNLTVAFKDYGIWTKMKAVWPFVGGTATSHKFNLANPADTDAAFRLFFAGGWTHSATGALPNGSTGYANTYFNPVVQLTNYNAHLSVYTRTNTDNGLEFGVTSATYTNEFWIGTKSGGLFQSAFYDLDGPKGSLKAANSDARGFYCGSSTSQSSVKIYKNGTIAAQDLTTNTSTPVSDVMYLGAVLRSGVGALLPSDKELAFASVGTGLTDTEVTNLNTAVQNFQAELSRQV